MTDETVPGPPDMSLTASPERVAGPGAPGFPGDFGPLPQRRRPTHSGHGPGMRTTVSTTTPTPDAPRTGTLAAGTVRSDPTVDRPPPNGTPRDIPADIAVVDIEVLSGPRRPADGVRRSHDGDWLDAAFRRDYAQLVRLAAYLADRDVAEEIVQDAFVRTHGRLHGVDADNVTRYLRAAVVNGARSHLRRRLVQRRHAPAPPPPFPAAEVDGVASVLRTELLNHLDRLPRRQREVLLLRYFLDLSEQEIADTLGVSTGTVKQHAHRGLTTLATVLGSRR